MNPIGIFFGSTNGNTEAAAHKIKDALALPNVHGPFNLLEVAVSHMQHFPVLILGVPTWNVGELQDEWASHWGELDAVPFAGKTVALFGCGDAAGYPDTFQDAMGMLHDKLVALGAHVVGQWPTAGYLHAASRAVQGGNFVGLALDEESQPELTDPRIQAWVAALRPRIS